MKTKQFFFNTFFTQQYAGHRITDINHNSIDKVYLISTICSENELLSDNCDIHFFFFADTTHLGN